MCDPAGLLIYTILLIFSFIAAINLHKQRSLFLILLFLAAIFAAYRGSSGVDTPLYIIRFHYASFFNLSFIEPIIPFMMALVKDLGGSFVQFSILYGFLLSILYYLIFKKCFNSIYFGLSIFPVIFIDSLYNGVRVGLAYPLIMLALANKSNFKFIFASFSHISSLIIAPYFLKGKARYLLIIGVLGCLLYFGADLKSVTPDRYVSKIDQYSEITVRNSYGGMADSSALFVALLTFFSFKKMTKFEFFRIMLLIGIGILILHLVLVSRYVFMLRIVRLIVIVIYGLILSREAFSSPRLKLISALFGIVYTLNFIRQIMATCSYENGFLPLTH